MLKRILIAGPELDEATMSPLAEESGVIVTRSAHGDSLPAGAVAVLSSGKEPEAAIRLAIEQATRHEALFAMIAMALDAREDLLPGSTIRVAEHATRFAQALNLEVEDQLTLERGAYLRDLGKTRIPNEVLLKKSMLSYDEWALLQSHTTLGSEIVLGLEGFQDTEAVICRHHCCFDGTGYPDGLEGEAIPLLARAMKILDVYCAMTSPRHYREGHSSHEEAIAHIESERGKHFDPDLAKVFIEADVGRPWQANSTP